MSSTPPLSDRFLRVDAGAAADGRGLSVAPASMLLGLGAEDESAGVLSGDIVVQALGTPAEVDACLQAQGARVISRPDCLLTPGFVNAHSHLDLTHIAPRPFQVGQGFGGFVDLVRRERASDEAGIAASVQAGIALSLKGGGVAVGDIAGAPAGQPSLVPYKTLARSLLGGVSFVEFFAVGKGELRGQTAVSGALAQAADLSPRARRVLSFHLGLQPHAPTTVSLATYLWLMGLPAARGMRLAMHLAETPDEHEFIARGEGPHRAFLESIGLWDDSILGAQDIEDGGSVDGVGLGKTPVQHLAPALARAPFVCAHVNDASDEDIQTLARTAATVVYCPRASDYFRARDHFGPHRYREMLAAGINVALGTDSIINLPAATDRLSTFDEARFLYQRDGTDPVELLRMATTNGARALGLNEEGFGFSVGSALAGLVAVPLARAKGLSPLAAALSGNSAPELLLIGN